MLLGHTLVRRSGRSLLTVAVMVLLSTGAIAYVVRSLKLAGRAEVELRQMLTINADNQATNARRQAALTALYQAETQGPATPRTDPGTGRHSTADHRRSDCRGGGHRMSGRLSVALILMVLLGACGGVTRTVPVTRVTVETCPPTAAGHRLPGLPD